MLLNGWPEGWFDLYVKRGFADHDPIAAHCETTVNPFVWSEVYRADDAGPRQQEVMQRATDFRMVHGFCVPIHDDSGFKAVVTMAGRHPDLSKPTRSAIQIQATERDREQFEYALTLLAGLMERFPDCPDLHDQAAGKDMTDEVWLAARVLALPRDDREALVQFFLRSDGGVRTLRFSPSVMLLAGQGKEPAAEPDPARLPRAN